MDSEKAIAQLYDLLRELHKDITDIKTSFAAVNERCNDRGQHLCRIEKRIDRIEERLDEVDSVIQRVTGAKAVIAVISGVVGAALLQLLSYLMEGK